MAGVAAAELVHHGVILEKVGQLLDSSDIANDVEALRRRMAEEGYLFLPGYLDREEVLAGRREIVRRMAEAGQLDPAFDPMEAVLNMRGERKNFQPELAEGNAPLQDLLYGGRMIRFYERLLGGAVRHFDFTWLRSVCPGTGTRPHLDSVYMNRGTPHLYTAWVPLGDIDYELGGLMILEGSVRNRRLRDTYGRQDVDGYCLNKPQAHGWGKAWGTGGWLNGNPNRMAGILGGEGARWLTAEFRAGDLLTFPIWTVHASLDNRTRDRVRFSSDSRYQLASEPADERWVGAKPVGHGVAGRRGRVC